MAHPKNAARRLFFVSFIFIISSFFETNCHAVLHSTELIKPSFFFSPLSYCAFQALYQDKKEYEKGFSFFTAPYFSKNFSRKLIASGLGASTSEFSRVAPDALPGDLNSDHLIAVLTKNNNPLLQRINETTERPRATISLDPEQKESGIHIILRHDLDFLIQGVFYSLEVSWGRQKRKLNPKYSDEYLEKNASADIISIHDFFTGSAQSIYDPLRSLKLSEIEITQQGFENVQATLGYNVIDKNDYRITLLGCMQLPCGPDHELEFLFSPDVGKSHLQFGLGWNGFLKIGGNKRTSWYLSNNAMGGYSFPADEPRIPTLAEMPWGHYQQMLLNNSEWLTTGTPGVDMLPRSINVKQGLSLQNTIILTYKHQDICIDAGFSAAYREGEQNVLTTEWKNETTLIPNKFINPYNFTGASNNPSAPSFSMLGKMYPTTAGRVAESLSTQNFALDGTTMVPVTTGAWAQNMTTKSIDNKDLLINLPTVFTYQFFASAAKKFTYANNTDLSLNIGCNFTFGEPSELVVRHYQLWIGAGCSF